VGYSAAAAAAAASIWLTVMADPEIASASAAFAISSSIFFAMSNLDLSRELWRGGGERKVGTSGSGGGGAYLYPESGRGPRKYLDYSGTEQRVRARVSERGFSWTGCAEGGKRRGSDVSGAVARAEGS
jgi:hypothetical protein